MGLVFFFVFWERSPFIFTARVRSTREGTVFTGVCLFTSWGGGGGTHFPGPGRGDYYLARGGGGGTTLRCGGGGVLPTTSMWGSTTSMWGGYYLQAGGTTSSQGVLPPGRGGTTWVLPHRGGTTSSRGGGGYYLQACTWYAAGSMPLAFRQEDFLVKYYFLPNSLRKAVRYKMSYYTWQTLLLNMKKNIVIWRKGNIVRIIMGY